MPIRDLTDGSACELVLLVRSVERRQRANGADFLKVTFADRTGTLATNVWDDVEQVEALLSVGAAYRVYGKFEVHERFGPQLRLEGFDPAAEGSYDPSELRAGPPVPVAELERRLRALVASVRDAGMSALLEAVLGEDTQTWAEYRVAPAAKRVHQAYRHGLLEHCLTVAEAVSGAAGVFPGIDRDLAVSAALIHDFGKLEAYALVEGDSVELTDAGRLRGEIVLGYERLHRELDKIDGISEERKQAFLHIILSHHGHLEHGSPVVPQTREAFLVHMMDNLGGKLGIIDRLEQERAPDSAWSGFDRAFGGSVWFPEAPEGAVADPSSLGAVLDGTAGPAAAAARGAAAAARMEHAAPAEPPREPVVPLGAFEDSGAWQPPHPDDLDGPPLPTDQFTATPDHAGEPLHASADATADPFHGADAQPSSAAPGAAESSPVGPTDPFGGPAERYPSSPGHTGAETVAAQRATASDRPAPPDPEPLPF
ncbi:MAG: HD domain-containing protein [Patulibacter minatonensis]